MMKTSRLLFWVILFLLLTVTSLMAARFIVLLREESREQQQRIAELERRLGHSPATQVCAVDVKPGSQLDQAITKAVTREEKREEKREEQKEVEALDRALAKRVLLSPPPVYRDMAEDAPRRFHIVEASYSGQIPGLAQTQVAPRINGPAPITETIIIPSKGPHALPRMTLALGVYRDPNKGWGTQERIDYQFNRRYGMSVLTNNETVTVSGLIRLGHVR